MAKLDKGVSISEKFRYVKKLFEFAFIQKHIQKQFNMPTRPKESCSHGKASPHQNLGI